VSAVFEFDALLANVSASRRYQEFFRIPAMSAGIYVLPAGAEDHQHPHDEDEIYFVVRGKAKMQLGTTQRSINERDVIFVEAELAHRFFDIEQELALLVFFAPAETD
jgi:mannose-6-phosphate isomerase-like protein (cupin superfamily)